MEIFLPVALLQQFKRNLEKLIRDIFPKQIETDIFFYQDDNSPLITLKQNEKTKWEIETEGTIKINGFKEKIKLILEKESKEFDCWYSEFFLHHSDKTKELCQQVRGNRSNEITYFGIGYFEIKNNSVKNSLDESTDQKEIVMVELYSDKIFIVANISFSSSGRPGYLFRLYFDKLEIIYSERKTDLISKIIWIAEGVNIWSRYSYEILDGEINVIPFSDKTSGLIRLTLNRKTDYMKFKDEFKETEHHLMQLLSLIGGSITNWSRSIYFTENENIIKDSFQTISKRTCYRNILIPYRSEGEFIKAGLASWNDIGNSKDSRLLELAIDWYLESITVSSIEIQYINALTCLEVIKSFKSEEAELFICSTEKWNTLKKKINKKIKEAFPGDTHKYTRSSIYKFFSYPPRNTFGNKLKVFLNRFGIPYHDLLTKIEGKDRYRFIDIRDYLIHTGSFYNYSHDLVEEELKNLLTLLERIFLTIFNYHGNYNDRNSSYEMKRLH